MRQLPLIVALSIGILTGCSTLIPKRVEIGQDKVQKFPEEKSKEREIQRQAADRVSKDALELLRRIISEGGSSNVLKKASDTAIVADAVSDSLGPPLSPSDEPADKLAQKLNNATAKLQERIVDFRQDNDENVGKKIEGTGFLQIPYFLWIGGLAVAGFLAFAVLRVVLAVVSAMNPGVALGTRAAAMSGKVLSKAFSQVIAGGQRFKTDLKSIVDDEALREKIVELFVTSHRQSQDEEIQSVVKHLIKG